PVFSIERELVRAATAGRLRIPDEMLFELDWGAPCRIREDEGFYGPVGDVIHCAAPRLLSGRAGRFVVVIDGGELAVRPDLRDSCPDAGGAEPGSASSMKVGHPHIPRTVPGR